MTNIPTNKELKTDYIREVAEETRQAMEENADIPELCPKHGREYVNKEYKNPDSPLVCLQCEIDRIQAQKPNAKLFYAKPQMFTREERKYPIPELYTLIGDTVEDLHVKGMEESVTVDEIAGEIYRVVNNYLLDKGVKL